MHPDGTINCTHAQTQVGYGDIGGTKQAEYFYCCFAVFFGTALVAWMTSEVTLAITQLAANIEATAILLEGQLQQLLLLLRGGLVPQLLVEDDERRRRLHLRRLEDALEQHLWRWSVSEGETGLREGETGSS